MPSQPTRLDQRHQHRPGPEGSVSAGSDYWTGVMRSELRRALHALGIDSQRQGADVIEIVRLWSDEHWMELGRRAGLSEPTPAVLAAQLHALLHASFRGRVPLADEQRAALRLRPFAALGAHQAPSPARAQPSTPSKACSICGAPNCNREACGEEAGIRGLSRYRVIGPPVPPCCACARPACPETEGWRTRLCREEWELIGQPGVEPDARALVAALGAVRAVIRDRQRAERVGRAARGVQGCPVLALGYEYDLTGEP